MSNTDLLLPQNTSTTPRALRGAAAVIAKYIQDVTRPVAAAPCATVA